MSRPRVCVATSIHPYHDNRILHREAVTLAAAGFQVTLLAPWAEDAHYRGVHIRPGPRAASRAGRVRAQAGLLRLAARERADLYHFHDIDLLPGFAALGVAMRRHVVYDVHENYAEEILHNKPWIPRLMRAPLAALTASAERVCSRGVRNVVAVTEDMAARFSGLGCRVALVRNFASREMFPDPDAGAPVSPRVVFSGMLSKTNGAELLLDIVAETRRREPGIRFLAFDMFSDETYRKEWLARASAPPLLGGLEIRPRVPPELLGAVLRGAFCGLSLSLDVPNQRKGVHAKFFEYMACRLPVVSTDVGHSRSIVADAACGLVLDPADVGGFADAIATLWSQPARARELGANGRRAFERRYCWEREGAKLVALYDTILGSRSR